MRCSLENKKALAALSGCAFGMFALDLALRSLGIGQQPVTGASVVVSLVPAYGFLAAMCLDADKRLDEAERAIDSLAEKLPVSGLHVLGDDGAVEGQKPAEDDGEL